MSALVCDVGGTNTRLGLVERGERVERLLLAEPDFVEPRELKKS